MDTIDLTNATPKPVQLPHDERLHRRERAIAEIAAYASGYSERREFKYERHDTADGLDLLVLRTSGTGKPWHVASRVAPPDEHDTADMRLNQSRSRILHTCLTWAIARAGEVLPKSRADVSFDRVLLTATQAIAADNVVDPTECAILELNYGHSLAWSVKVVGEKAHVALSLPDARAVAVGILPWTAMTSVNNQPAAIEAAKNRLRVAMLERSIKPRAKWIARRTAEHRALAAAEASA